MFSLFSTLASASCPGAESDCIIEFGNNPSVENFKRLPNPTALELYLLSDPTQELFLHLSQAEKETYINALGEKDYAISGNKEASLLFFRDIKNINTNSVAFADYLRYAVEADVDSINGNLKEFREDGTLVGQSQSINVNDFKRSTDLGKKYKISVVDGNIVLVLKQGDKNKQPIIFTGDLRKDPKSGFILESGTINDIKIESGRRLEIEQNGIRGEAMAIDGVSFGPLTNPGFGGQFRFDTSDTLRRILTILGEDTQINHIENGKPLSLAGTIFIHPKEYGDIKRELFIAQGTALVINGITIDNTKIIDVRLPRQGSLRKGDKGQSVQAVQELLVGEGYLEGEFSKGQFDDKTEDALIMWQKKVGLSGTGRFNLASKKKMSIAVSNKQKPIMLSFSDTSQDIERYFSKGTSQEDFTNSMTLAPSDVSIEGYHYKVTIPSTSLSFLETQEFSSLTGKIGQAKKEEVILWLKNGRILASPPGENADPKVTGVAIDAQGSATLQFGNDVYETHNSQLSQVVTRTSSGSGDSGLPFQRVIRMRNDQGEVSSGIDGDGTFDEVIDEETARSVFSFSTLDSTLQSALSITSGNVEETQEQIDNIRDKIRNQESLTSNDLEFLEGVYTSLIIGGRVAMGSESPKALHRYLSASGKDLQVDSDIYTESNNVQFAMQHMAQEIMRRTAKDVGASGAITSVTSGVVPNRDEEIQAGIITAGKEERDLFATSHRFYVQAEYQKLGDQLVIHWFVRDPYDFETGDKYTPIYTGPVLYEKVSNKIRALFGAEEKEEEAQRLKVWHAITEHLTHIGKAKVFTVKADWQTICTSDGTCSEPEEITPEEGQAIASARK